MESLRATATVSPISPNSTVDVLKQIEDQGLALQSDIGQIVREYNSQVVPILGSLPLGNAETRWVLSNSINPRVNGLDGSQIFIDNEASLILENGYYFDSVNGRPLTIKEGIAVLQVSIDALNASLQTQIADAMPSGSGVSSAVQGRIGDAIFDLTATSSSSSLDGRISINTVNLLQVAKDVYGQSSYSLDNDGNPNLANSLLSAINALLAIHHGNITSDLGVDHIGVAAGASDYNTFMMCAESSTTATSLTPIGSTIFNPQLLNLDNHIYFDILFDYTAVGSAGNAEVELYDLGTPSTPASPRRITSITRAYTSGNQLIRSRVELDAVASPTADNEEINLTERVIEVRIGLDGTGDPLDSIRVAWAGMTIEA